MYIPQYISVGIQPVEHLNDQQDIFNHYNYSCDDDMFNISDWYFDTINATQPDAPTEQLYKHTEDDSFAYNLSHVIHGPVMKLLACVLITVPTCCVICKMRRAASVDLRWSTTVRCLPVTWFQSEGAWHYQIRLLRNSLIHEVRQ